MPGKAYITADTLSRRLRHSNDSEPEEDDIDDQILSELGKYKICPVRVSDGELEENKVDEDLEPDAKKDLELAYKRQTLQDIKDRIVRLKN